MPFRRTLNSAIDDVLTSKRSLSEFIEGMGLCGDACNYYSGTGIADAAADTSQKANWIIIFLSEMSGRAGWPSRRDLTSDILSEIQNLSSYYSGHTWAEDTVDSIDDWINGSITDAALAAIGHDYMMNKPYGVVEQKVKKIFDAIICLCMAPEGPSALVRSVDLVAQAVAVDPNKTNNKQQELRAITVRINPSKYVTSTITEQID